MKRVLKSVEPYSLQSYKLAQPQATWEDLKNDALHGGKQAYADIRSRTHLDQGGLCAFCELDIRDNNSLKSRVEHFHPKSDNRSATNWALNWQNMLAVCAGGSHRHSSAPYSMEPLNENLSCDAHKDRWIQKGRLEEACEGWVIDPALLPSWPSLFEINKFNGELRASEIRCNEAAPWPNNQHANTKALVEHTIAALNLNCNRLCQARLVVIRDIERNKKKQHMAGLTPQQGLEKLAQRYLQKSWPGFFTTICLCLGAAADAHLKRIAYSG